MAPREMRIGVLTGTLATLALIAACTFGDGEGGRYTGRVVSISGSQLCVGPNTSSPTDTCGSMPAGFSNVPRIGQCVSLFAHVHDHGKRLSWTKTSLKFIVPDRYCAHEQTSSSATADPAPSTS
jgi:hypothetical protein